MSAAVLDFNTSRTLLSRAALRAAGIADPLRWRVESVGERYEVGRLMAMVDLVAADWSGVIQLARFMTGEMPTEIGPEETLRLALDAAVVSSTLRQRGREIVEIRKRWVFDDGGYIEDRGGCHAHIRLLEAAHRSLELSSLTRATTAQIVSLWVSQGRTGNRLH